MTDPVPSKDLFPGEPTAPWDRKDLAGPPLNDAAWNYELRSYYERWQRGARQEIERLRRELSKPAHEREPPHCSSCACGLAPEPADDLLEASQRVIAIALGAAGKHAEKVVGLEAEVSTLREHLAEINRLLSLNVAEVERLRASQPPRDG